MALSSTQHLMEPAKPERQIVAIARKLATMNKHASQNALRRIKKQKEIKVDIRDTALTGDQQHQHQTRNQQQVQIQ